MNGYGYVMANGQNVDERRKIRKPNSFIVDFMGEELKLNSK